MCIRHYDSALRSSFGTTVACHRLNPSAVYRASVENNFWGFGL